jgi:hypothetical protein
MKRGEKGESRRSPEAVAAELRERRRGYMASANGEERTANPFPDFTALARAWWEGYDTHQRGGELPSGESTGTAEAPATVRPPPPRSRASSTRRAPRPTRTPGR